MKIAPIGHSELVSTRGSDLAPRRTEASSQNDTVTRRVNVVVMQVEEQAPRSGPAPASHDLDPDGGGTGPEQLGLLPPPGEVPPEPRSALAAPPLPRLENAEGTPIAAAEGGASLPAQPGRSVAAYLRSSAPPKVPSVHRVA